MKIRVVWLAIGLVAVHETQAGDCSRRLLTETEKTALAAVVVKTAQIAPDMNTIVTCRQTGGVWIDTVREAQPDGSERWFRVVCYEARKSWPEPWICSTYPFHGFRADSYPGELGVWVEIHDRTTLAAARRDVARAFRSLAESGDIPACEAEDGGPKSLAALRAEITNGDGMLSLGWEPDGFSIADDLLVVKFKRIDGDDAAARAYCWAEPDVVVTS